MCLIPSRTSLEWTDSNGFLALLLNDFNGGLFLNAKQRVIKLKYNCFFCRILGAPSFSVNVFVQSIYCSSIKIHIQYCSGERLFVCLLGTTTEIAKCICARFGVHRIESNFE